MERRANGCLSCESVTEMKASSAGRECRTSRRATPVAPIIHAGWDQRRMAPDRLRRASDHGRPTRPCRAAPDRAGVPDAQQSPRETQCASGHAPPTRPDRVQPHPSRLLRIALEQSPLPGAKTARAPIKMLCSEDPAVSSRGSNSSAYIFPRFRRDTGRSGGLS